MRWKQYLDYKSAEEVSEFFFFFLSDIHMQNMSGPKIGSSADTNSYALELLPEIQSSEFRMEAMPAWSYFPGSIKSNCSGVKSRRAQKPVWHTLACCLRKSSQLYIGKGKKKKILSDLSPNVSVVRVTSRGITILKPSCTWSRMLRRELTGKEGGLVSKIPFLSLYLPLTYITDSISVPRCYPKCKIYDYRKMARGRGSIVRFAVSVWHRVGDLEML